MAGERGPGGFPVAEFVRSLPPHLLLAMAELARQGKLAAVYAAAASRASTRAMVAGLLSDEIRPGMFRHLLAAARVLRSAGRLTRRQTRTTTVGSVKDVQRVKRQLAAPAPGAE